MMDLSRKLYMVTANPHIDLWVLTLVEVSAVVVLILLLVTCICCFRQKGERYKRNRSSSRDNAHLNDLLSKPSLADPESVFSEAGSYAGRLSIHASSFYERSSTE